MRWPAAFLLAILLAALMPASLLGQWRSGRTTPAPLVPGSASFERPVPDSLGAPSLQVQKSPSTAVLLSAVLPGAGQFYNESYWKVPIVLGLGGYFVAEFLHNNRLYKQYRDEYASSVSLLPSTGGDPTALRLREFYKDQRNEFAFYFLILYFVNLVDAYVDAVLFDFNMNDDLSLRTVPGQSLRVRVIF